MLKTVEPLWVPDIVGPDSVLPLCQEGQTLQSMRLPPFSLIFNLIMWVINFEVLKVLETCVKLSGEHNLLCLAALLA